MMKKKTEITAVPGHQELFITREFDAPRELVFKAFTDPTLLTQWLGPRELTMVLDTFEPRPGGSWRYVHTDAHGGSFGFHGVFHEVNYPHQIIQTFEFEGLPETGHVSLETAAFETLPGNKTRLTIQAVYRSVADRDGIVQSGMERGVTDGHERLDTLLASLQAHNLA